MNLGSNKLSKRNIVKARKIFAKELRDNIIKTIYEWENSIDIEYKKLKISFEDCQYIKEKIKKEVYNGLVWKALDCTERYNTLYHKNIIEELRKLHPDLEVHNNLNKYVTWPAFRKEDIETAFNNTDVKPLLFNNDKKIDYDGNL